MKKLLPVLLLMLVMIIPPLTHADSVNDYLFYSQVVNERNTIYISQSDGAGQRALVTGKNVKPFLVRKHFLYYTNHQLFEYDLTSQKTKPLAKFSGNSVYVSEFSDKPDAPDQALITADNPYSRELYVLEFSDGSVRLLESILTPDPGYATSARSYNPDESALAIIKQATLDFRFELSIQEKIKNRLKTVWTLPENMTIIPENPVWSPNSRMLAFYAKEYNGREDGFYSLYLYNLDTRKLHLVQEQVFAKIPFSDLLMGPFTPEWSQDSKYLIFQHQPLGLPTGSVIMKYDAANDQNIVLTSSRGHNIYPTWSPTGKSILFISNRDSAQDQVYTMDGNGEHLKRLSPAEGYTDWASWFKN